MTSSGIGGWDLSLPVRELILPSNGPLAAGSGTFAIEGPNMPAELTAAGYSSALVWYSPAGNAGAYKYYFLAQSNSGALMALGFVNAAGQILILQQWATFGDTAIYVRNSTTDNATVELNKSLGNGAQVLFKSQNGAGFTAQTVLSMPTTGGSFLTDVSGLGTLTDQWISQTTVVTGSLAGATSWTMTYEYHIGYDREVELRFKLTPNTATTVGGTYAFNAGAFQAAFPNAVRPSISPNSLPAYGSYSSNNNAGTCSVVWTGVGGNPQLQIFSAVSGITSIVGALNYHINKV